MVPRAFEGLFPRVRTNVALQVACALGRVVAAMYGALVWPQRTCTRSIGWLGAVHTIGLAGESRRLQTLSVARIPGYALRRGRWRRPAGGARVGRGTSRHRRVSGRNGHRGVVPRPGWGLVSNSAVPHVRRSLRSRQGLGPHTCSCQQREQGQGLVLILVFYLRALSMSARNRITCTSAGMYRSTAP